MISYDLFISVEKALAAYTRGQVLALAALGLERLWPMFYDWTCTDGDPLLYQKPLAFRKPMRDLLDAFWAQAEGGQMKEETSGMLDSFLDFINASCDGNDAPDVDMGTGRPLLDLLFGGVDCFFSERDAEADASDCITRYAAYLSDRLYDRHCGRCKAELSGFEGPEAARQRHFSQRMDSAAADDPLWRQELARIEQDFRLVKSPDLTPQHLLTRRKELHKMAYVT